ncbi:threonine aspartase 1-like [Acropora millepora]|uniref:threonine aspartase 1-like n=1 Tax=Acropora millepora TaxID=45264 RepID=UPI001CF169B1|nr:threonine aspartase 1-like [Acropora millepora]
MVDRITQSLEEKEEMDAPVGCVAVHIGAGFHSLSNESEYKEVCRAACSTAMEALKKGLSAKEIISVAITALEDLPCTNAGLGSNLTRSGTVECDASIMDGQSMGFGAVGALKGIRNPIQVACKLLEKELQGPSMSGLIPPCFLAGEGAFNWALEHGFCGCCDDDLITERSFQTWNKCRSRLTEDSRRPYQLENLCNFTSESETLDTVGAVCMDRRGNLCAGVSSGGVLFKTPGRIGQAALYGSGCWATSFDANQVGVACCTSGCGEHLMKTLLAKECASLALKSEAVAAVQEALTEKFLGASVLSSVKQKLGGVLLLRVDGEEAPNSYTADIVWGHTSDSMCIGYMTETDTRPKVRLSRLRAGQQVPLVVEGAVYRLPHR